jgi:hypothetical protein
MTKADNGGLPLPSTSLTIGENAIMPAVKYERQKGCLKWSTQSSSIAGHRPPGKSVGQDPVLVDDRKRFELMLAEVVKEWQNRDARRTKAGSKNGMDREAFIAALQSVCVSRCRPESFKSVPTVKAQLLAEFIHLHYAKTGEDFFPSKMILTLTPDTASFAAATNTLYLAQLATSTSDQRLLQNAARTYQGALQLLRRDLSKPKACYDDHLFGAIHVLSLCEAFKGIAIDDRGLNQHTKGAAMLFQARGPESLQNVYMMIELQQHHHRVLLDGLLSRKRPLIGRGRWLDVDKNCYLKLTSLTTLALRVPGVLEDADRLLAQGSNSNLDEIMDMLSSLKSLETKLQNWMSVWYAQIEVSPYWKIPSTTFQWLPRSNTFASGLEFPTPLAAKAHVLFWMPLLCLREAMKKVAELHPFPILATTILLQQKKSIDDINEITDHLCMTAMYLMNPLNGVDGCMEACGPLLLVSRWFEKINDHERLMWCYQMFDHIESRGIRASRLRSAKTLPNNDVP